MTLSDIAVALAVTAGVLLVTAAVLGTYAGDGARRRKEEAVPMAWTAFAISMALFVAAAWTGVAS